MKVTIIVIALAAILCGQVLPIPTTNVHGGGASYTGPGDIITSGAVAWWGLRAYSAATAGNRAVNVCIPADAACADLSTNASGNLVITTIGGSSCSIVTCTIKIFYDQTGAMLCSGPCDLTQGVIAQRLVLMPSGIGSLPIATDSGSQFISSLSNLASAVNQPLSLSSVGERTASTSSFGDLIANASSIQLGFSNAANTVFIFGGNLPTATGTDNAFHALQSLFNGASSSIVVDGTVNTVNAGTNSASAQFGIASPNIFTGNWVEAGMWSGDQSSHFSTLNTNQHAYWGF